MRKFLFLLVMSLLVLSACNNSSEEEKANTDLKKEKEIEKKTEMTETAALNYLEQVTYRYLNASTHDNGSFEQESELNAAIQRAESIKDEIIEKYEENLPIAEKIIELSERVKEASQSILDGNYESMYDKAVWVGELLGEISQTHLNGELPPTAKIMTSN